MATTKSGTSTLSQIAHTLKERSSVTPGGQAYRCLPRGLHIVYGRIDGACRLALGREAPSIPSDDELDLVATAFAVPDGAEPNIRKATWRHPTTARSVTFNVVELTWRELAG